MKIKVAGQVDGMAGGEGHRILVVFPCPGSPCGLLENGLKLLDFPYVCTAHAFAKRLFQHFYRL